MGLLNVTWPTPESRFLWLEFNRDYTPSENSIWTTQSTNISVEWFDAEVVPTEGSSLRLVKLDTETLVLSSRMEPIGKILGNLASKPRGVINATVTSDSGTVDVKYMGPEQVAELFN